MAGEEIVCDACGLPPHGEAAATIVDGLPAGWFIRVFGRRRFRLCDCCGSIRHFKGGVSAYLQEALGLSEHAVCDFAAGRGPSTGLHRRQARSRDQVEPEPESETREPGEPPAKGGGP